MRRGDYQAEPLSTWDTLGFRGTCSSGFTVTAAATPTRSCRRRSPTSWPRRCTRFRTSSGARSGPASPSMPSNQARAFVRAEARKTPGETPISAIRLAEVDRVLQEMRQQRPERDARISPAAWCRGRPTRFTGFGFSIRTNNLKLSRSQLIVDIVGRAMLICGICGLPQRFEIQPVAPPARRLRRGPDGQQRPHHETQRHHADGAQGRVTNTHSNWSNARQSKLAWRLSRLGA